MFHPASGDLTPPPTYFFDPIDPATTASSVPSFRSRMSLVPRHDIEVGRLEPLPGTARRLASDWESPRLGQHIERGHPMGP